MALAVALPAAPPPAAAPASRAELLAALQRPRSVRARFVQDKAHPAFKRPQRSVGRVELVRPDRLRFVYESPHQVEIQLDGERVQIHYPRAARTQTLDRREGGQLDAVFDTLTFFVDADPARLAAVYEVTVEAPATLVLVPRDRGVKEMIARVRAEVDVTRGVLRRVTLEQTDASVTTFTFLDPEIDAAPLGP